DRTARCIEQLQEVDFSVFFGCTVAGHLFFSTAVEPSEVNRTDRAAIWHSVDGEKWRPIRFFPKDRWPSRLFQYGQVQFPAGPGEVERLFFSPFATVVDHCTTVLALAVLVAGSAI